MIDDTADRAPLTADNKAELAPRSADSHPRAESQPDAGPLSLSDGSMHRDDPPPETPHAISLGRHAQTPAQIPWRGWRQVLIRTARETISDRISMAAASCAFYATLSLFPAITMLVSIYGLVFDPNTVEPQLEIMRDLLPPSAFDLIEQSIKQLVAKPHGTLTSSLVISVLLALWSASTGTKSMLSALNVAYDEVERRGIVRYQLTALGMTLFAILVAILALAVVVLVPIVLQFVGLSSDTEGLARVAGFAVLVLFVLGALSLLYRYGPSRRRAQWQWVTPGSFMATVLWLLASTLFSFYVGHIASYDATYGPLGAVVGAMMWFYFSALVVLIGAELNSELELQTAHDSTRGGPRPMGARGAYVADHVAEG